MKRYWHYTVYDFFIEILKDEEIKAAIIGVDFFEKPGVWLSTNPVWEETVRKSFLNQETGKETEPLSRDDLFKMGSSPIRIEINPRLVSVLSWKDHKKKSGITKEYAKAMEDIAKRWGANPDEWYVSYKSISLTSWLYPPEIWNGKNWINFENVFNFPEES